MDKEVMFLWNRTCLKAEKKEILKNFGILDNVSADSKYAAEYPENVEVKELPLLMCGGKRSLPNVRKTGVYVLRALLYD
jgi:hypothetical protein